ncbi:MAG: hypothetical protein JNL79_07270 [Myxococcales bacterium]|nr:hypothetical protein [Myxococcales bacterium]
MRPLAGGCILATLASSAVACEAATPSTVVDCGAPTAVPATPLPPGTPDVPGSTVWYEIPSWSSTPQGKAFDLDHRVRCRGGGGCLTSRNLEDPFVASGEDNALRKLFDDLDSCFGVHLTSHRVLLRLDGLGEGDDPLVRAALYPQHLDPSGDWIVDSAALEDGVSLDKPRFRLADGFVRDRRFWSLGSIPPSIPLRLPGRCVESMTFDLPLQPRVFTLDLTTGRGTLGGVVAAADAAAGLAEAVRLQARCSEYTRLADQLAGDVVATSVTAPNEGLACDALSASLDFHATATTAPGVVGPWVPPPRRPEDVCLSRSGHDAPPCPPLGCRSVDRGPDGRLYATAAYVWPDRAPEPPLPDNADLAVACATLAACLPLDDLGVTDLGYSTIPSARVNFARICASNEFEPEAYGFPLFRSSVRLGSLMRIALGVKGDCRKILAARTAFEGLVCSPQGCGLATTLGAVTCVGDDAHFASGAVRHCAEAFVRCSATSPTGCTDRLPIRCAAARDHCDGAVLLGCDKYHRVTFRDCSRYGGTCMETTSGADCTSPTKCTEEPTCSGDVIVLCTRGSNQLVDCKAIGFAGCVSGRCVP